jgi:hypothetical protein
MATSNKDMHSQGKRMNALDFFLLQMNNEDSRIAARSIELNFRCLTGPDGFDKAIKRIERNWRERLNHDWVKPLLEELRTFYVPYETDMSELLEHDNAQVRAAAAQILRDASEKDDEYTNPLNEFLSSMLTKANGGRPIFMQKNFDLAHFTAEELSKPHMQWLTLFVNRYNELKASGHKKQAIRLTRIHPCHSISDELGLELANMYEDNKWFTGLEFGQFVSYYVKSRDHFDVENETLNPDYEARMKKTLHVWHEGEGKPLENHLSWLARNYDFHPLHHPFLRKFIAETLNISE